MHLVRLSGSGPLPHPLRTHLPRPPRPPRLRPRPRPRPRSRAGIEGSTAGAVMIGFKGRTHDWLQEETFLFLNLDQRKPFIFISDSFFKFAPRYLASREAVRALVLSVFRSLFRNEKRPIGCSDSKRILIGWLTGNDFLFEWLQVFC